MTSPIITQVTFFLSCNIAWVVHNLWHLVYTVYIKLLFTVLTVLSSTQKWFDIKSSKRRKDRAYTGLADATSGPIFARSVNRTRCTGTITMYSACLNYYVKLISVSSYWKQSENDRNTLKSLHAFNHAVSVTVYFSKNNQKMRNTLN